MKTIKPYICEWCENSYEEEEELVAHLIICPQYPGEDPSTTPAPFFCGWCEKEYPDQKSFDSHIMECPKYPGDSTQVK